MSMWFPARRSLARGMAVVLMVLPLLASGAAAQTDPYLARAFEVHHRSLVDAAELVGELLSTEGTLTLKPRMKILIVEDRRSVLDRVQALLESFDLPPRAVEVTLNLFLGTRADNAPSGSTGRSTLSKEIRGVIESLSDFTQWNSYEPLASRSITAVEGDLVVAVLSGEYRVAFIVEAVHEKQQVVKFERFSLQRVRGEKGREEVEDLYTAGMVLKTGKLNLVVAASAPDSKRALFLAVQVRPV